MAMYHRRLDAQPDDPTQPLEERQQAVRFGLLNRHLIDSDVAAVDVRVTHTEVGQDVDRKDVLPLWLHPVAEPLETCSEVQ